MWQWRDILEEDIDVDGRLFFVTENVTWHFGIEVERWNEICQTYTVLEIDDTNRISKSQPKYTSRTHGSPDLPSPLSLHNGALTCQI